MVEYFLGSFHSENTGTKKNLGLHPRSKKSYEILNRRCRTGKATQKLHGTAQFSIKKLSIKSVSINTSCD